MVSMIATIKLLLIQFLEIFRPDTSMLVHNFFLSAPGRSCRTLFDYLGEPSAGWPNVISSYGQYDLAGFPKAQAYWYR